MPRIVVSVFLESEIGKKALIAQVAQVAERVFCPLTGDLPLPKGSTEIIPDFRIASNPVGGPRIAIFLHRKPERTSEIFEKIRSAFAKIELANDPFCFRIEINDQPEKLWRKI